MTVVVSDDILETIAENVMSCEWRRLARCLRLTVVDIDAIETKHGSGNLRETCKDMLRVWKEKEKTNAIGAVLARALHQAGLRLIAERYIQIEPKSVSEQA